MPLKRNRAVLLVCSVSALTLALPVLAQNAPESLLPPGFGDPAPAPAPRATPAPRPSPAPTPRATPAPGPTPTPRAAVSPAPSAPSPVTGTPSGSSNAATAPSGDLVPDIGLVPPGPATSVDAILAADNPDDLLDPGYALPGSARRPLDQIGVLSAAQSGFSPDAFGPQNGRYLSLILRGMRTAPVSRWGSILLSRALLSETATPQGINPADWVALRGWILLRQGESIAARQLVAQVDSANYTPMLYEALMQIQLATGDPAGVCPYVGGGARVSKQPTWTMFRPICASFSGEQSTATALLNAANRAKAATGIDYLLAEKTIGAGVEGRRAVTIKWDEVQNFNNWRFGLAIATGVEPPERLYDEVGVQVQGWRAQAPMLSINSRLTGAERSSGLGVLSNRALVDLYAIAREDSEASEEVRAKSELLRTAYVAGSRVDRVAAMKKLWSNDDPLIAYSGKVATARAAARIMPTSDLVDDSSDLIASMLTAGLDRNAARWSKVVPTGSLGWGLLALGAPGAVVEVDSGALDDFAGDDPSTDQLRSKFLVAGLLGLGRTSSEVAASFADDLSLDLSRRTKFTNALDSAAERGEAGTVALLAGLGLQGRNWGDVRPLYLFHIVRALRQVGMEPAARMIAAEAIARS